MGGDKAEVGGEPKEHTVCRAGPDEQKQQEVKRFWDAQPCGSGLSRKARGEQEYFAEIEQVRYTRQPHIPQLLARTDWKGKKVLEIGTGSGTDARHVIARGGLYTGVNVDWGSTALTRSALAVFSLAGTMVQSNATQLPFKSETFDIVYTFGVLHHIPEVDRAIAEIHRILKTGGTLLCMLYNRDSINYRIEIMFLRKAFLRTLRIPGTLKLFAAMGISEQILRRHGELYEFRRDMTPEEWLGRNTDGPDNPFSRVYGKDEAAELLKRFRIRRQEVHFFDPRHWGTFGMHLPRRTVQMFGRKWGWHRWIEATKAGNLSPPT